MTPINLTPHPVIIRNTNGEAILTLPPAGHMARVQENNSSAGNLDVDGVQVPLTQKHFTGVVEGLPSIPDGNTYIVPLLTAIAAKAAGRTTEDLLVPGDLTRDANGTVNGCTSLARLV